MYNFYDYKIYLYVASASFSKIMKENKMEKKNRKAFENVEIEIVNVSAENFMTNSDDEEIVLPPDEFSIF